MQIYEKDLNVLSEFLGFLKFKTDSGQLTLGEAESLRRFFFNDIILCGTADELASFYGKDRQDVWNVVHRKMLAKPERKIYYPFREFSEIVPEKWKG